MKLGQQEATTTKALHGEALKWHYKGTLRDFQLLDPKLVTLRAGSRQSIQYYGKVETWPRIFCQESETSHFI